MKYVVTINDKSYEVEVERGTAQVLKTTPCSPSSVNTETLSTPQYNNATNISISNMQSAAPGETINAPMPGTVLAVQVSEGMQVKKGSVLFILEAMKMENEIIAPRDCIISKIATAKGTSVNTGEVLAVLN